jgi:hypothetical protein
MAARSENAVQVVVHEALTRVDAELDDMLRAVAACPLREREFVEHHVMHIRRHLADLSASEPDAGDAIVPTLTREKTEALLARARRIRGILEQQVLPSCRDPDGAVSTPLRALAKALAAVYSLEFPLEHQHPDLADRGPG